MSPEDCREHYVLSQSALEHEVDAELPPISEAEEDLVRPVLEKMHRIHIRAQEWSGPFRAVLLRERIAKLVDETSPLVDTLSPEAIAIIDSGWAVLDKDFDIDVWALIAERQASESPPKAA